MADAPDLTRLNQELAAYGLLLRSGFNFDPGEGAPARAVLLVGHAGAAHWPNFQAWLAQQPAGLADPLDTWSRAVIGAAAAQVGAWAVSPSDKPYRPFQQWAMRAEGLKPSPLGILMHPEYGLWHAYRGALLFDRALPLPEPSAKPHLCDFCADKPCLHACPVRAYSTEGFAYGRCLSHVRGESARLSAFPLSVPLRATEKGNHLAENASRYLSGAACGAAGCLDRNACPVGTAYRYPAAVQAFHMAAFARA